MPPTCDPTRSSAPTAPGRAPDPAVIGRRPIRPVRRARGRATARYAGTRESAAPLLVAHRLVDREGRRGVGGATDGRVRPGRGRHRGEGPADPEAPGGREPPPRSRTRSPEDPARGGQVREGEPSSQGGAAGATPAR